MHFLDIKARKGHTYPQSTKQVQIWIIFHGKVSGVAFSNSPAVFYPEEPTHPSLSVWDTLLQ